ncbi:MAG: DUF4373 domain-containing protein [Muribaculaceae bacterium]|nr:DUF4373 domain-containing protein [Muribaculaceae bacterium]
MKNTALISAREAMTVDTNMFQDLRIRKLLKYHGAESIAVYISLLGFISRSQGYYMAWDADLPFAIAEQTRLEEDYVSEVISYMIEIGLLSGEVVHESGVLTSKEIQERYLSTRRPSARKDALPYYKLTDRDTPPLPAPITYPIAEKSRSSLRPSPQADTPPTETPPPLHTGANINAHRNKVSEAHQFPPCRAVTIQKDVSKPCDERI